MENIRNRVDIHLVTVDTNEKKALKLMKQPNFKYGNIINNNLLSIEMEITNLEFNKPIYVGFSILDLSKYLMYEFYYDVLRQKYGEKVHLCYQDTDSFIIEVETEDVYKDMSEMKEYFDFSDYPKDHFLYDETNKKKVGYFKDELNGKILVEYVGLKPKQYSYKTEDNQETKKSKGVKKYVIKSLGFDDYKRCLFDNEIMRKEQFMIRAKMHKIYTIRQNKMVFNKDDIEEYKRHIDDKNHKIDTLAYGHYKIIDK